MFEVKDLKVSYGQSEVVHGIDFILKEKEILGIMGRNGMGKTTLFKSLIGILKSEGEILIDDISIGSLPSFKRVRHGVAYVPQGRMIFSSLSVEDNIKVGLETSSQKKIPSYIYDLFPVLHEMKNRKGGNLSGGQQQQLAIARALVTEPKILLLDEPTEGIQPSIIKEMAQVLRQIRDMKNVSIIVAEQVLSFAMDACDRFVVMQSGKFVHEVGRAEVNEEEIKSYLSV